LREAILSPAMIWEAVPQCRCSKSERFFTVPCGFDLWYFQNVVVSERIFRVVHMDKIMKTDRCKLFNYFMFPKPWFSFFLSARKVP
jgi:hypothetical protein